MKMIDVGEKERTSRVAVARAELRCSTQTLKLLNEGRLEKGDALAAARLAGIMAAKRTPDILPLCHPLTLAGAGAFEQAVHSLTAAIHLLTTRSVPGGQWPVASKEASSSRGAA